MLFEHIHNQLRAGLHHMGPFAVLFSSLGFLISDVILKDSLL